MTGPEARIALAAGGYVGVARLIALPFSAPALTGPRFDGVPGGVGEITGVGLGENGGAAFVFAEFALDGVSVGDTVGEGESFGVGVGVFRFAFALALLFAFSILPTLKLKLLSIIVLTFVF